MRLLRPQPNLRALPVSHIQGQWQTSKFDKSTGQVYTETTAAIQCSDDRNWTQEKYSQACITDEFGLTSHLWEFRRDATASRKGKYRTLKDIAIQCIVRNISDATLELINYLPSELRRQVWDALKESIAADNTVSFKMWSIFSESLHRDTPDPYLYHFACTIPEPKSPLNVYTAPLASKPLSFITSLNITVPCPVPDLVRLSDVTNLAVLEIAYKKAVSDRGSGIGDRLIRAWQLAALNSGAFPVLRILRLWDFKNVTERSLSFLNDFPALAVYDVRGCGFGGSSSPPPPLGWTPVSIDSLFNTLTSVYKDHVLSWFRLRNISTELEPKAEEANSQQSKPPPSFGRNKMTFISRAEVPDILNESGFTPYRLGADMWEEITYRLSPLIGATRNDIDLVRSKYNIGDPIAVQQVLGSSIPMVSLRLGYKRTARSTSQYTTYIRDNLTHPLNASVCESGRKVPEDGRESMHREATKRERQGQDVMQKKKRKLNDLLNSLL